MFEKTLRAVPTIGLALAVTAAVPAQFPCDPAVELRGDGCIGGELEFCLRTFPTCDVCVVISPNPGPIVVLGLTFNVGIPVYSLIKGRMPPSGAPFCQRFAIANDPNLVGTTIYYQAFGDTGRQPLVLQLGDSGSFTICAMSAQVGDKVYCDRNDNGVQDPGEPGLGGVEVVLECGDVVRRETTASDGSYLFRGVPPGECRVSLNRLSWPGRKVPGANCPDEYVFQLESGQTELGADFCFVDCSPCNGQVTDLTLRYGGSTNDARIVVTQADNGATLFDGTVQPGGRFGFQGSGTTMGRAIEVRVNGGAATSINTSCSELIGPGSVRGAFTVVSGRSRIGGPLCSIGDC